MASKTTLQAVDDPSLAFDPIKVGGDVVLAQHAEVIRALGKRVVHDVIEIGRRLTDAKARCGHGNWLPWLEREFGWSESTALRYMQAHQFATDKSVTVTDLSLKSLYLLAAPSTPKAARDEVIERSEAGVDHHRTCSEDRISPSAPQWRGCRDRTSARPPGRPDPPARRRPLCTPPTERAASRRRWSGRQPHGVSISTAPVPFQYRRGARSWPE